MNCLIDALCHTMSFQNNTWMAINSDNQNKNSPTAQSVEDHFFLRWVVNISSILGNGVCDLLCCSITAKNLLVSASDYHRSLQVCRQPANSCSYLIGNWQGYLAMFAKWLMVFSAFSPSTGMSLNAQGVRCWHFWSTILFYWSLGWWCVPTYPGLHSNDCWSAAPSFCFDFHLPSGLPNVVMEDHPSGSGKFLSPPLWTINIYFLRSSLMCQCCKSISLLSPEFSAIFLSHSELLHTTWADFQDWHLLFLIEP